MENENMYYSVAQYEDVAKKILPKHLGDFLEDAANDGITYRENELAFKRYLISNKSKSNNANQCLNQSIKARKNFETDSLSKTLLNYDREGRPGAPKESAPSVLATHTYQV